MLPSILNQLGPESLTHLKKLANNVTNQYKAPDDDDVPGSFFAVCVVRCVSSRCMRDKGRPKVSLPLPLQARLLTLRATSFERRGIEKTRGRTSSGLEAPRTQAVLGRRKSEEKLTCGFQISSATSTRRPSMSRRAAARVTTTRTITITDTDITTERSRRARPEPRLPISTGNVIRFGAFGLCEKEEY